MTLLHPASDAGPAGALTVEHVAPERLRPYPGNARTHGRRQIEMLARSITRFGFTNPVVVDDDGMILAGHGRVQAAKSLGLATVPVVRLAHMSAADKRAYVLADNRLAEKAGWDRDLLASELQGLIDLGVEVEIAGFEIAEADIIIAEAAERDPENPLGPEDDVPAPPKAAATRPGDVWVLGRHRLVCGDAREAATYGALMGESRADMLFTDPPYNVPISGHCRAEGAHREFAMVAGEMTAPVFTAFLTESLGAAAGVLRGGGYAYVCMDWRHVGEALAAGQAVFDAFCNLCVWTKANGGMGSLYRSQHELVFVFRHGEGPAVNTVELGRHGRNRTNVWAYAGANSFGAARREALDLHPTVKPVALVEDAIRDVTRRNDIVLDAFGGSGTTLIAAERCGRRARLVELDALYCDVIVQRWERFTGKAALHAETGETFEGRST